MAHVLEAAPLTKDGVVSAYDLIKDHVHRTPVLTSQRLNRIASTPQTAEALVGTEYEGQEPASPKMNIFFKCENFQRTGAFKIRGAFHALLRLVPAVGSAALKRRGVVTHSAGNHGQALALAARTLGIPVWVVMPAIAIRSKIEATESYGATIVFSGPTSQERDAVAKRVIDETGAFFVSSANHVDIILGQGTTALELEEQTRALLEASPHLGVLGRSRADGDAKLADHGAGPLDAVITAVGCGGLNAGVATYHGSGSPTRVFGAEPSFEGADDCRRGLAAGRRIDTVKSLTIADGLRQPVAELPWLVISDRTKVGGVYGASEAQIKSAMRVLMEQLKVVVEPSAAVALAVVLYNEDFRSTVEHEAGDGWDVGVVLSGGNTTVEMISKLYQDEG